MSKPSAFADHTCIVTGANRGIGLALTRHLLEQGAVVYAGCRQPDGAQELQQLRRDGGTLHVLALDITSEGSVQAFAGHLPKRIDLLINNAGINVDGGAAPSTIDVTKLQQSFDTNTLGPLRMVQALLPQLRASKAGKVANISSIMGSIEENSSGGLMAYRTSKTALNMVNKCLALEETSIVFLTLHPGWVKTAMGGEQAPVSTPESAQGLLQVIANAKQDASGSFLRFDGKRAPW